MIYEIFPLEYIALSAELATGYHPRLERILQINGGTAEDIDLKLAQIAAYCGVMLDGVYDLDDRRELCVICVVKLQALRENPHGTIYVN